MPYCSNCGAMLKEANKFCSNCGHKIAPMPSAPPMRPAQPAPPMRPGPPASSTPPTQPAAPAWHTPPAPPAQPAPPSWAAQAPPPAAGPSLLSRFLNEEQDPGIVNKVYDRVSQILTRNEKVAYVAVQKKLLKINLSPDCVVLTTRRFIIYHAKVLGQVDFEDYIWRDLKDAQITEGIIGAVFTMSTVHGKQLVVEHLPKAQARKLYAFAQDMEERVLEERRLRAMEETRAAAGGVILQGGLPPVQPQAQAAPGGQDPVEQLTQLKRLVDAGLITAAEYEVKKREVLSRM